MGCAQYSLLAFGDLFPSSTEHNFISYEWFKAVFQASKLALLALLCFVLLQLQRLLLLGDRLHLDWQFALKNNSVFLSLSATIFK